jgi:hypothetical protein
MSSLLTVLAIAVAVVLVLVRQTRPQRITGGGSGYGLKWLALPVVLVILAPQQPGGLLDAHHRGMSVALLGVELVVGLLMGVGWAWTSRIWTEQDGSAWARGTKATAAVWVGGIAVRLGLMGIGSLMGVHQGTGALLLALAASVVVRGGLLQLRARSAAPLGVGGTSYGVSMNAAQPNGRP